VKNFVNAVVILCWATHPIQRNHIRSEVALQLVNDGLLTIDVNNLIPRQPEVNKWLTKRGYMARLGAVKMVHAV